MYTLMKFACEEVLIAWCMQEVMHSLVGVLLSRNIRAQQVAAATIADICTIAPRMQEAFFAVCFLTLHSDILA